MEFQPVSNGYSRHFRPVLNFSLFYRGLLYNNSIFLFGSHSENTHRFLTVEYTIKMSNWAYIENYVLHIVYSH